MCLTCGCHRPFDPHGDPANITYGDLAAAADAAGISVEQAAANLTATLADVHTHADPAALFLGAAGLDDTTQH
jgi:hypothetical protein